VSVATLLSGLGAGLLLGLLLDLPATPAQRLTSGAGVASLLGSGTWLLLDRHLGNVAVGVLAGVLLALGAGLVTGLETGLIASGPTSDRPRGIRDDGS
jgi:hypothetical protein